MNGYLFLDYDHTGSWNMAVDEVLFDQMDVPCLRFYRWAEPVTTIGYLTEYPKENNGSIIRRLTGGGLVEHDRDWTYSFIIPKAFSPWKSLQESYHEIHSWVHQALMSLGVNAYMTTNENKTTPNQNCFENPVYHDLMLEKRKILGGAQRKRKGKLLYQGNLILPLSKPIENGLKKKIISNSEKYFNISYQPLELKEEWIPLIKETQNHKYQCMDWNMKMKRRS